MNVMLGSRARVMLWIVAAVVVGAVVAGWALPRLVAALPGRVRQYVPEAVVERVTTPLPAALPAPTGTPAIALALAEPASGRLSPDERTPVPRRADDRPQTTQTPQAPLATEAVVRGPSSVVPPLPPYARVAGLPIIPQKFNNCGPTNLTLVLNHFGIEVDQFDVAAVVRPNYEDRNVSPDELVEYVNASSWPTPLRAAAYVGGDLDLLRRLLHAGLPVIIEKGLMPDEATGWMGHYLTLYGYDDITSHFLARDTYLGPWRGDGLASYRDTERYWEQFNNAFIVVYPPEREAEVAELLGPAFADPTAMWAAVAERARAAARLDVANPFVWFNLGASLTELAKLGDPTLYEAAAAAYDQARLLGLPARMMWYRFGPYEAYLAVGRHADVAALAEATLASQGGRNVEETYLYQGRALAATGDAAGARAAFARAARLNPDSSTGRAALAELEKE